MMNRVLGVLPMLTIADVLFTPYRSEEDRKRQLVDDDDDGDEAMEL